MICSTTGNNENLGEGIYIFLSPAELLKNYSRIVLGNTGSQGVANCLRLLVNLLQHEMLIAALFSCLSIPVNLKYLLGNWLAQAIGNPYGILLYNSNLSIIYDIGATGTGNNSRNIGSDEILIITQTNNHRVVLLGANQLIRVILAHEYDGIGTLNALNNLTNGCLEIAVINFFQKMGQNLSIRVRQELMALCNQILFKSHVVLDNTVMYNRKIAMTVSMWMRVIVGWTTMGCPTGMTDTDITLRNIALNLFLQSSQTAYGLLYANLLPIENCNTSRVIATILQLGKSLNKEWGSLLATNVTNDTTHNKNLQYKTGSPMSCPNAALSCQSPNSFNSILTTGKPRGIR